MTSEARLATIVRALERAGLRCLVMGGHAVRFYGLHRNTIDFDLHLAPERWDELPGILARIPLFGAGVIEGNSWRPQDFRRFQIGRLSDGREEWLEFWRQNHLLAPFEELEQRRELGEYGGKKIPFLSLSDLIRSKETERLHDWQDIERLEEFLDARSFAQVRSGNRALVDALIDLRSRHGLETFFQSFLLEDAVIVGTAIVQTTRATTQAMLLPFSPATIPPDLSPPLDHLVIDRLCRAERCSSLHFALVEAIRRQYRTYHQERDRQNKEAIRRATTSRDE